MLEPGSFDICMNAVIPMIVMLGHSEIDIEISDIDIETVESDNCREISIDDRNINGVLTAI